MIAAVDWEFGVGSMVVAAVAVAAAVVAAVVAVRRSGWRRSVVVLETTRVGLVLVVAAMLLAPSWVRVVGRERRPVAVVLVDDTGSMATRDVVDGGRAVSRREAAAGWTDAGAFGGGDDGEVEVVVSMVGEAEGGGTDLGAAIARAAETTREEGRELVAVAVVGDGDWNAGDPPSEAALRLKAAGVGVVAVPVGGATPPADVRVASVDAPSFAVAGKSLRVPVAIESTLPRPHDAVVTITASSGATVSETTRLRPMGTTRTALTLPSMSAGETMVRVEVAGHADEIRGDNNAAEAAVSVREERLKVLVVESEPRWEYRFLRNALSRDPGVEVSCLLFHPGADSRGGGNADYVAEFPATKEMLSKFDVCFLGDVGIGPGGLSVEQAEWLDGWVRRQAGGLVLVPGRRGRQASLAGTPLGDISPVDVDPSRPGGWGSRTAGHFDLTSAGRSSLLTKLADDPAENAAVWAGLPGFSWWAAVVGTRPGCETLAVHADAVGPRGRLPLLATRAAGGGKVLFLGTDAAWRWRRGVEDKYHYRFWGQVVRWMAYRRNIAEGESMRLYFTPERPRVGQSVAVTANVMGPGGDPVSGGDVTLRVVAPEEGGGGVSAVRLVGDGDDWGAYAGTITPAVAGDHRLRLLCDQTGETLEATLPVAGAAAEPVDRVARPEVLEELARMTGGEVLPVDRPDRLATVLASTKVPPPEVRRRTLWDHPLVMIVLMGGLTMFWAARKAAGLF